MVNQLILVNFHTLNFHVSWAAASASRAAAVIATAAPHKFPEAIAAAGIEGYTAPASVTKLAGMETKYQEMKVGQDWLAILLNKIRAITEARKEGWNNSLPIFDVWIVPRQTQPQSFCFSIKAAWILNLGKYNTYLAGARFIQ